MFITVNFQRVIRRIRGGVMMARLFAALGAVAGKHVAQRPFNFEGNPAAQTGSGMKGFFGHNYSPDIGFRSNAPWHNR